MTSIPSEVAAAAEKVAQVRPVMQVAPILAQTNAPCLVNAVPPPAATVVGVPQADASENTLSTSANVAPSSGVPQPTYQMVSMNINGVVHNVLVPLTASTTSSLSTAPALTDDPAPSGDEQNAAGHPDPVGLKVISPRSSCAEQTSENNGEACQPLEEPAGVHVVAPIVPSGGVDGSNNEEVSEQDVTHETNSNNNRDSAGPTVLNLPSDFSSMVKKRTSVSAAVKPGQVSGWPVTKIILSNVPVSKPQTSAATSSNTAKKTSTTITSTPAKAQSSNRQKSAPQRVTTTAANGPGSGSKVSSSNKEQPKVTTVFANGSRLSSTVTSSNKETAVTLTKVNGNTASTSMTPVLISQPGLPGSASKIIFLPTNVTKNWQVGSAPKPGAGAAATATTTSSALPLVSLLGGSTQLQPVGQTTSQTTQNGGQVFIVSGSQVGARLVSVPVPTSVVSSGINPVVTVKHVQPRKGQSIPVFMNQKQDDAAAMQTVQQAIRKSLVSTSSAAHTSAVGTSTTVLNPVNTLTTSQGTAVTAQQQKTKVVASPNGAPGVNATASSQGSSSIVSAAVRNMPKLMSSLMPTGNSISCTSSSAQKTATVQSISMPASALMTSLISGNRTQQAFPPVDGTESGNQNVASGVVTENTACMPMLKIDSVYSLNSAEVGKQQDCGKQGKNENIKGLSEDRNGDVGLEKLKAEENKNKTSRPKRLVTRKESGQCPCCVTHRRPKDLLKSNKGTVLQGLKDNTNELFSNSGKQKCKIGPLSFKRKFSGSDWGYHSKRVCDHGRQLRLDDDENIVHFRHDLLRQVKPCSVRLEKVELKGKKSVSYRHWVRQEKKRKEKTRKKERKTVKKETKTKALPKKNEKKKDQKCSQGQRERRTNSSENAPKPQSTSPVKPEVTAGGSQVLAALASRVFGLNATTGHQQSAAIISSPKALMLGHPSTGANDGMSETNQGKYRYLLIRTNTGSLMVTPLADTPQLGEANAAAANLSSLPQRTGPAAGQSLLRKGSANSTTTAPTFLSTADINPLVTSGIHGIQSMPSSGTLNALSSTATPTGDTNSLFGGVTVKSEPITYGYGDESYMGGSTQEPEVTMTITKEEQQAQEKRIRKLKAMLKEQEKRLEDLRRKRNAEKNVEPLNFDDD